MKKLIYDISFTSNLLFIKYEALKRCLVIWTIERTSGEWFF